MMDMSGHIDESKGREVSASSENAKQPLQTLKALRMQMAVEQRMARTTTDIMDNEAAMPKHKLNVGTNKHMERYVNASASHLQKSAVAGDKESSVHIPRPSDPAKTSSTARTSQLAAAAEAETAAAAAARVAASQTVIRQHSVAAHSATPTAAAPHSERSVSMRVASSTRQFPPHGVDPRAAQQAGSTRYTGSTRSPSGVPAADPRAAQLVSILNQAQREERLRNRKAVQEEGGVRIRAQSQQHSIDGGGGAGKPSAGPVPRPALRARGWPGDGMRGRSLSASHEPTAATSTSQEGSPRGASGEAQRRSASGEAQRGGVPNTGASAATRGWVPGGKAVGRSASVGRVVSRRMREDGLSAASSSASVAGYRVEPFHTAIASTVRPTGGSAKVGGMILEGIVRCL